jgi:hypothetical protein
MRKAGRRDARQPVSGVVPFLPLAAVLLIGLLLRAISLTSDIGGFLAWNEANYLLVARHARLATLLLPSLRPGVLFFENPPLVPYVIALVSAGSDPSVVGGRLVVIAFSLLLIVATWRLGRLLLSPRAALVGAAVSATAPVAVVTGSNIQTDAAYLALTVLALEAYVRARRAPGASMAPFGVLIGLAAFAKLFSLVALPAILLWEIAEGSFREAVSDRRRWTALLGLTPCAGFYVFHFIREPSVARTMMFGQAAVATSFPRSLAELTALAGEAVWVFSPVLALALVAGIMFTLPRRDEGTRLLLCVLLAYAVFYLRFHKHSYYLLSFLPFAGLLFGRAVDAVPRAPVRRAVLAAVLASAAFVAVVDVTGMKLGFSENRRLVEAIRASPRPGSKIVAEGIIVDNVSIVLDWYLPGNDLWRIPDASPLEEGRRVDIPEDSRWLLFVADPNQPEAPGLLLVSRDRYALELFGWTIAEEHRNPNTFRQGPYHFIRSGSLASFGFPILRSVNGLGFGAIEPGDSLYRSGGGIEIRGRDQ